MLSIALPSRGLCQHQGLWCVEEEKMPRMSVALAALAVALLAATTSMAADKVQIGTGKVLPESMTASSDGTLYAGSLALGQVFRAAPGAPTAEKFIDKPADGPQAILGVFADEKGGTLWVCYSDLALFSGKAGMNSILRVYDLKSGETRATYDLGSGSLCNDVTVAADGTHFIADTAGGRILRLKPDATTIETWSSDSQLQGIDGIAVGPDGAVYANSVTQNKLFRIDVDVDGAAGRVTELAPSQPLKGTDGMRFGGDGILYLAENGNGQVDAVTINGDTAAIRPVATGLDGPTALSKVGNTLWVLEARISKMGDPSEAGPYYMIPFDLGG
jgi:sugar lactone lactonase YvrE